MTNLKQLSTLLDISYSELLNLLDELDFYTTDSEGRKRPYEAFITRDMITMEPYISWKYLLPRIEYRVTFTNKGISWLKTHLSERKRQEAFINS